MATFPGTSTERQQAGTKAEDDTLAFLQGKGLLPVTRNFRCRFGEIDLIMREGNTIVFIEVRKRKNRLYGGAAASITAAKQQKIIKTARFYLQRYKTLPACRFDVVAWDGNECQWLQNAIEVT